MRNYINVTQVSKKDLGTIVNICNKHTLLKLKVVVWTIFLRRLALEILLANERRLRPLTRPVSIFSIFFDT